MIQRLIFPHPKTKADEKTSRKIIYVPSFKSSAAYRILSQYVASKDSKSMDDVGPSIKYPSLYAFNKKGYAINDKTIEDSFELPEQPRKLDLGPKLENKASIEDMESNGGYNDKTMSENKEKVVVEKNETFLVEPNNTIDFSVPKQKTVATLVDFDAVCSTPVLRDARACFTSRNNVGQIGTLDNKILVQAFEHYIPCLYYPRKRSQSYLLYFHSNAEDITQLRDLARFLSKELETNVIIMEYPGYSVYKKSKPSAGQICIDAERLVAFLTAACGVALGDISIMGRSIGSGPAIHLCSKHRFGVVTLVSPFLSIKQVVKDKVSFISNFVDFHFDNEKKLHSSKTPLLLLHGKNDKLIGHWHSERLYEISRSKAKLVIFDDMPHNHFNFYECVVEPTVAFMRALKLNEQSQKAPAKLVQGGRKGNPEVNRRIKKVFSSKVLE